MFCNRINLYNNWNLQILSYNKNLSPYFLLKKIVSITRYVIYSTFNYLVSKSGLNDKTERMESKHTHAHTLEILRVV